MICVLVRTLNEQHRISQFCKSYEDASKIIIADGGSTDKTCDLASQYKNVEIIHYTERVYLQNGYWRNPDAEHNNFLIDYSKQYNPEWLINDDCDGLPNLNLKRDYRKILRETKDDFIMAVRLYQWGDKQHFPHMAKPGKDHTEWEASLWAWRGNIDFKFVPVPPAFTFRIGDRDIKDLHFEAKVLDLYPPYCLIHKSWDDPIRVDMKIKTYRESGLISNMAHPLDFAGPLEDLPDWAVV